MNKFFLIIMTFIGVNSSIKAQEKEVFSIDFRSSEVGVLTKAELEKQGGEMRWVLLEGRATIVEDAEKGNVIQTKYPKGTVGPQTNGVQFIKTLPESDEYYLDYYVKFEEGFDFVKGGKLPGLTSGGSTYTGGNHPDNGEGWSARYMWVNDGDIVVYFYYMDMTHEYGDPVKMNVKFETGKWYRLTQRIKLNQDNLKNGVMQVWVDGKEVLHNENIRYRLWGKGMIDTFYFSTFHGGATEDWAPKVDSYIKFDDFKVTIKKPSF